MFSDWLRLYLLEVCCACWVDWITNGISELDPLQVLPALSLDIPVLQQTQQVPRGAAGP